MPNFTIQEGSRKGSKIFVVGNNGYIKDKSDYFKCRNSKSLKCNGTAKMINEKLEERNQHTCGSTKEELEVIKGKAELKKLAEKANNPNKIAFDEFTASLDPSVATQISYYNGMESAMRWRRKQITPPIAKSLYEIELIFGQSQSLLNDEQRYFKYFKMAVKTSTHSEAKPKYALVFYGDQVGSLLNSSDATDLFCDATFSVCPTYFYQYLVIHFEVKKESESFVMPGVHILMPAKSSDLYEEVLRSIAAKLPLFKPRKLMADYEVAISNSFEIIWPDISVSGCWFHMNQAIFRKVQTLGLSVQYAENESIRDHVRCLMGIALLPPEAIMEAFEKIVNARIDSLDSDEDLKLKKLKNYMRNYWI